MDYWVYALKLLVIIQLLVQLLGIQVLIVRISTDVASTDTNSTINSDISFIFKTPCIRKLC